jgi:hypothetical protein
MKVLYSIEDKMMDELKRICNKPEMSKSDLEDVYKMVDIIKDVSTVEAMRDAGYSQANVRMSYDDPAMSYMRYGNRSYDDGYSERRGRDAMGRYTSRDGYSTHNESMIDMLKDKMHNTTSEVERENYRRVIEQLER